MTLQEYLYYRDIVEEHDPEAFRNSGIKVPPTDPTDFALRVSYVILNSGMKWAVTQMIWKRLRQSLVEAGEVGDTFGHPGKKQSINQVMQERDRYFQEFRQTWLEAGGRQHPVLEFCETLPHIGPITKFHLSKNLGVDCAKPDIWLTRVAARSGEEVQELCSRLSREHGDSVAKVDFVIWKACQQGWWPTESSNDQSSPT